MRKLGFLYLNDVAAVATCSPLQSCVIESMAQYRSELSLRFSALDLNKAMWRPLIDCNLRSKALTMIHSWAGSDIDVQHLQQLQPLQQRQPASTVD